MRRLAFIALLWLAPSATTAQVTCADANDCAALGAELHRQGSPRRARDAYRRACRLDSIEGCFQVARFAERGFGGPVDYAVAREQYARLCDEGEPAACNNLGVLYEDGRGMPSDPPRALRLFKSACQRGDALSCANAGRLHRSGAPGVPVRADVARRLFRRACAGRSGLGCRHLAQMLEERGALGAARARYQAGCEAGDRPACHGLAMLYAEGRGVPADLASARRLLAEQCQRGYRPSCREGQDLGCEDGDPAACLARGSRLLEAAREANVAPTGAAEALRVACDGGEPLGCARLAALEPDGEAAAALRARACQGGVRSACPESDEPEPEARASTAEPEPEPQPTRASTTGSTRTRPPRGTVRGEDVVMLLRTDFGGTAWIDGGQGAGGSFAFDSELGLRLLLDPGSGLTLNPAVGGRLAAGDRTAVAFSAGADLGFEIDWAFVSYGARFLVGALGDADTLGVRHGARFELGGVLGIHVAHELLYADGRSDPLHGVTVSISVDAAPTFWPRYFR